MIRKFLVELISFLLPIALVVTTGCGGDDDDDTTAPPADSPTPTLEPELSPTPDDTPIGDDDTEVASPSITIVSPSNGAVQPPFFVSIEVENFVLEPEGFGQPNESGHGQWHLLIDGEYYGYSGTDSMEVTSLEAGNHTLQARLVKNNQQSLTPDVLSEQVTVSMEDEAPSPSIEIVSPSDGELPPDFTILVEIQDFTLSEAIGEEPVEGEGHWLLYVDEQEYGSSTTTSRDMLGLALGEHTLQAELVENDGASLDPPVVSSVISITVVEEADPSISIISPTEGTVGFPFDVTVEVVDFTLDPLHIGGDPEYNHGYWQLMVDGELNSFSGDTTLNVDSISPGDHQLKAVLVQNNHLPLDPPVESESVNVTVSGPSISIASPTGGDVSETFSAVVNVQNFVLDQPESEEVSNVTGHGQWALFVDDEYQSQTSESQIQVQNLSVGEHSLVAELRNYDGSSLEPAVLSDEVIVNVAAMPSIEIIDPLEGEVSVPFAVVVSVENFTLDASAIGGDPERGRGHWQLFIDGEYAGQSGSYSYIVNALTPGEHTLQAELVANDNTSLEPPATSNSVTVLLPEEELPTLTILEPVEDEELRAPFDVTVDITNFELDPESIGGEPIDGQGHWHLEIDGELISEVGDNTVTVESLSEGEHTLRAELVANDHQSLEPAVDATVKITVLGEPSITILSPLGNIQTPFGVLVAVQNFELSEEAMGSEPQDGIGHWQLLLNGEVFGYSGTTTLGIEELDLGEYTLQAELVQNDHSSFDPQVLSDTVTIEVVAPKTITIVEPSEGEQSFPFTVVVEIENFTLDPENMGGDPVDDSGHWELEIDGEYYDSSATTGLNVEGLMPGEHDLQAELVNNDGSALEPAVQSGIVTIVVPSPTIAILEPEDGSTVTGDVSLRIKVDNLILDPDMGSENIDGHGHYEIYLNGVLSGQGASDIYELGSLKADTYQIEARLVDNMGEPLEPLTSDSIEIKVEVYDETAPRVEIISPENEAEINSSSTELHMGVSNFTLDESKIGGENEDGVGHYHILVDDELYMEGTDVPTVVTRLHAGEHLVKVLLVNNDCSSLDPEASDTVSLTVPETAPMVFITSPENGATVSVAGFDVTVSVENFELSSNNIGGTTSDGEGHYHVYLDGSFYAEAGTETLSIGALEEGSHDITVELVENNHVALEPSVIDTVSVEVAVEVGRE